MTDSTNKRLPRTYDEIFKRTLDRRGRPVKSLRVIIGPQPGRFA